MKIFKKEINVLELLISILLLLIGGFMIYWAIYFIYAYHFTSALWLYMQPMTTLVVELILGIFLIASAYALFTNRNIRGSLYRFSGILIMLCSINLMILEILDSYWHIQKLLYLALFPIGLFLYLFFNQKKYIDNIKNHNVVVLLGVGVGIYFLIDIIFYNWTYF